MSFINGTASFQIARGLACVNAISMNWTLKKSAASITTVNSVVFAWASIAAHFAWNIQKTITFWKKEKMLCEIFYWKFKLIVVLVDFFIVDRKMKIFLLWLIEACDNFPSYPLLNWQTNDQIWWEKAYVLKSKYLFKKLFECIFSQRTYQNIQRVFFIILHKSDRAFSLFIATKCFAANALRHNVTSTILMDLSAHLPFHWKYTGRFFVVILFKVCLKNPFHSFATTSKNEYKWRGFLNNPPNIHRILCNGLLFWFRFIFFYLRRQFS